MSSKRYFAYSDGKGGASSPAFVVQDGKCYYAGSGYSFRNPKPYVSSTTVRDLENWADCYIEVNEDLTPVMKFPRWFKYGGGYRRVNAATGSTTYFNSKGERRYESSTDLSFYLNNSGAQEITEEQFKKETAPKPVFPRYSVPVNPRPNVAYVLIRSEREADLISPEGQVLATDRSGVDYYLSQGIFKNHTFHTQYREITEAEAKALVKPPAPKVRYFQHTEAGKRAFGGSGTDHFRVEGDKTFRVNNDGTELETCDHLKWFSDQPLYYKEVFPQSSDSLLRSHRYAEKYNEGKAAGKKEAEARVNEYIAKAEQYSKELFEARTRLMNVERELKDVKNQNDRLRSKLSHINQTIASY